ncbi:MAG: hypothetical protein JW936_04050 [Sedimentisphaerales bacterium]|nr:hypothetical protein [Sedimentisphaerales bacterium]
MGRRRDRLNKRLANATQTRQENSLRKERQHARTDAVMLDLLKKGDLPYTPGTMSWLSVKLGKKASRITTEDVKSLLA